MSAVAAPQVKRLRVGDPHRLFVDAVNSASHQTSKKKHVHFQRRQKNGRLGPNQNPPSSSHWQADSSEPAPSAWKLHRYWFCAANWSGQGGDSVLSPSTPRLGVYWACVLRKNPERTKSAGTFTGSPRNALSWVLGVFSFPHRPAADALQNVPENIATLGCTTHLQLDGTLLRPEDGDASHPRGLAPSEWAGPLRELPCRAKPSERFALRRLFAVRVAARPAGPRHVALSTRRPPCPAAFVIGPPPGSGKGS